MKHMTLNEVKNRAFNLMTTYELIEKGWSFEFDNAKKRFGCCKSRIKTITLSKPLAKLNLTHNPDKIINTIKHEIAHALVREEFGHYDKYGQRIKPHGKEWQDMCRYIGIDPQRCYDSTKVIMPKANYTYKCPKCGKEYGYSRILKRQYSCNCEGKGFKRHLVLELQGDHPKPKTKVRSKTLSTKFKKDNNGNIFFDLY